MNNLMTIQSLGQEGPLRKEMAIHSSILAWKIPWMEEPGGLQSMGSQRVGHNWATNTHTLWYECQKKVLGTLWNYGVRLSFLPSIDVDLIMPCPRESLKKRLLGFLKERLWKSSTQYASKFERLNSGTGLEKVSFHSNSKERQCQRMLKLLHNCTHLTCYKVMLKILQARLQQYMNRELPDVQAGFRKGRGTRDQIANIRWII